MSWMCCPSPLLLRRRASLHERTQGHSDWLQTRYRCRSPVIDVTALQSVTVICLAVLLPCPRMRFDQRPYSAAASEECCSAHACVSPVLVVVVYGPITRGTTHLRAQRREDWMGRESAPEHGTATRRCQTQKLPRVLRSFAPCAGQDARGELDRRRIPSQPSITIARAPPQSPFCDPAKEQLSSSARHCSHPHSGRRVVGALLSSSMKLFSSDPVLPPPL